MAAVLGEQVDEKFHQRSFNEDGYTTRIMSNLLELRRNGEFCDITLTVDNEDFHVHKVVLVASSPYFSAMFRGNMNERFQDKVHIKEVKSEALKLLLDFSYTGQITVTERNVEDLLFAADLFSFEIAKAACEKFLQGQLDPSNCLGILHLGEKYSCKDLCTMAKSFINQNFKAVAENDEILKLDAKQLRALVESEDLHVDNEHEVLNVITKWITHDPENNRKWLSSLLLAVKLSFIPPKKLGEISDYLCKGDISAQDIIEEAKVCHCECAGIAMRNSCASWLYIFGGEKSFMRETRSIEYFDCKSMEWKETKKMAGGRVSCAVTVLDNKLYVIGGCKQGEKLNTVQCYSPNVHTWKNVAHLSKCQGDVKAAVLNGKIYVAGGSCTGQATCSYVEKYCPINNRWSTVCNMTHRRRRFGLVSLDNSLYAVGGFDDSEGFLYSVECYVLESNQWSQVAPMNLNRGDFGTVQLSGYIYAVGGVNERQGSLSSVERYNPSSNVWSEIRAMKSCRGGLAAAVYCGKIFALNGMNEYMSAVDSVECYDETTNSWNTVASTNTARFGAVAIDYPYLISK